MSETDEGSTGFELLDDEAPIESSGGSGGGAAGGSIQKTQSFASRQTAKDSSSGMKGRSPAPSPAPQTPASVPAMSNAPATTSLPQQVARVPSSQTVSATGTAQPVGGRGGQQILGDAPARGAGQHNEEGQGDETSLLSPQLNADMVWSGLQWGASLLSRVTEKATESVNKVITTLDPQMKPIIFSGGTLNIVVASDKSDKIMPIQDAFWDVFGRATVEGVKAQPSSMAAQPVGFTAGLKAAEDRVTCLRAAGELDPDMLVVAVESFVAELSTDRWSELACVLLQDKARGINVSLYTQATPLEEEWVTRMKEDTPPDYPLSWCGFAKTIGEVASDALHCPRNAWHERHTGLPRSALIYQAARSLAYIYQQKLQAKQADEQVVLEAPVTSNTGIPSVQDKTSAPAPPTGTAAAAQ